MPYASELTTIVSEYLGEESSWSPSVILSAIEAEKAAQAAVVRYPADPVIPPVDPEDAYYAPALAEALCRRVAHNLALRSLPLGLQVAMSEMAATQTRVGGTDAEVKRLEGPYRRLVVG